jgi:hypothetical protein
LPFLSAFLPRLAVRVAAEAVVKAVEVAPLRGLPEPFLALLVHLRLLVVQLPLRLGAKVEVVALLVEQRLRERQLL